ncbi:YIP1 family protein, partial [Candidatus Micrarchaeota archaeon]|nr:YIP1 family protein [Candidatus Micrarchaeota archaeon]
YYVGYGISHLMIKILGGKAPFVKTAQIYIYGSTPTFLLGWIPVVGIIAQLIALSNIVLGVKNVHQMSLLRSIIAVILLPLILVGIIAAILVLLLGAAFFSIVGSGVPIPMQ